MQIIVDAEFRKLLPPPSGEARAQLEESLLAEGCRDPLVVWEQDGKVILLDGHNRHAICTKHDIDFKIVTLTAEEIPDRAAAIDWIYRNQLARRNLSFNEFALILGRRYNCLKKARGGTGANQYTAQSGQDDHSTKTADKLAEEHGVSEATVRRAGQLAEAVEKAKERDPDIERKVVAGEVGRTEVLAKAERPACNSGPAKDANGREIPPHLTAVFETRERFERFAQTVSTLKGQVRQAIKANPAAWDRFSENEFRSLMQQAHDLFKLSGPFIVCPYCGASQSENCRGCRGTGFLNRAQARCVPREIRPGQEDDDATA